MSDLTDELDQIRESAERIGEMLAYKDIPDPSRVYIEPSVDEQGRRGPSIILGCDDHGTQIYFQWGNGGRVYLPDVISEARKHLDGSHR